MKRVCSLLMVVALVLTIAAGCSKGTKVHYEQEGTIEETQPVVTGDEAGGSSRTFQMDKKGNVHYEEETTTETTRPVVTGD